MVDKNSLHVVVVSPEWVVFDADAESISVPGEVGRFEVLKGHAPIISSLAAGEIVIAADAPLTLNVAGGFIEVAENEVSVCVELV